MKNSPTSPFNLKLYEIANSQEEFKHVSELVEKEWDLIAADLGGDARFQKIGDDLLKSSLKVIVYWQFAKIIDEDDRVSSFNELDNQYVGKEDAAGHKVKNIFGSLNNKQTYRSGIGLLFIEELQRELSSKRFLTLEDVKQVEGLLLDADYLWDTYLRITQKVEHREFVKRHRKGYIEKIVEDKWEEISQIPKIHNLISTFDGKAKDSIKLVLQKEIGGESCGELEGHDLNTDIPNINWLYKSLTVQQQEVGNTPLEEINNTIRRHYYYEHLAAKYSSLSTSALARMQSSNDYTHCVSKEVDEAVPFIFNDAPTL